MAEAIPVVADDHEGGSSGIRHPVLSGIGLGKAFGGTIAVQATDISLFAERVHGIIGANGAGKSVLTKMLSGVVPPDSGHIELDGAPVVLRSPDDALRRGIVTVHQDINLIETMSVAENLFFNNELRRGPLNLLDLAEMQRKAGRMLASFDVAVDPKTPLYRLPNDQRKLVQLLRALNFAPKVLMLDEPTSSLTKAEARKVLQRVRQIACTGVAVTFISHYLDEVFAICDDLTIIRDGRKVWGGLVADTDLKRAVALMIGRNLLDRPPAEKKTSAVPAPVLEVDAWTVPGRLAAVSFSIGAGEIVGITGLQGAGASDLALSLAGSAEVRPSGGTLRIAGEPCTLHHPGDGIAAGMAVVTADRLRSGVLRDFSLTDNLCLPSLAAFSDHFGFLDASAQNASAIDAIARLHIRCPGPSAPIRTLSGGNQQKVMIAKWLQTRPRVLILDEPTIGVDVGSKDEIRGIIEAAARSGIGIVLMTTELPDLLALCQRVLVMFRGAIVGEFHGADMTESAILQAASGDLRQPAGAQS